MQIARGGFWWAQLSRKILNPGGLIVTIRRSAVYRSGVDQMRLYTFNGIDYAKCMKCGCSFTFDRVQRVAYCVSCVEITYKQAREKAQKDREITRKREKDRAQRLRQKVIDEVLAHVRAGLPLNYAEHGTKKTSLFKRAKKHFGSWRAAVEAAGLAYDEVSVDSNQAAEAGHQFEEVLGAILRDLRVSFEKYAHDRLEPDFVLGDGLWIDAKLSESTGLSGDDDDVRRRYEPYCKQLTIIFLRGNPDTDRKVGDKTRQISVWKYVKQLPKHLRKKYSDRLREIEAMAG